MTTLPSTPSTPATTVHHPLSAPDAAAMIQMRQSMPPVKMVLTPEMRGPTEEILSHTPDADGVSFEQGEVGGIPGWWVRPQNALPGAAILYQHGGAYVVGSASSARHLASQLAARAGVEAFVPEYRLAPEHLFPAAIDDAMSAYHGQAELGYRSTALAGESAGGGLALVTLAQTAYRTGTSPAPRCAAVISPWTDLSLSGESMTARDGHDPLLGRGNLGHAAGLYLGAHDPHDPLASPLLGDLAGLPPVRLHVGEDEVLMDDARRYAEKLNAAGGEAQVHVWAGMVHVFPSGVGTLEAAAAALDDLGEFLRAQLR